MEQPADLPAEPLNNLNGPASDHILAGTENFKREESVSTPQLD